MLVEATLNRLDWAVLLIYFVIAFGIGVEASRRQKTEADYFHGRSVGPPTCRGHQPLCNAL